MQHVMPPLPYAPDSLSPILSAETLSYHYGKHLQTYVNNLNRLIQETPWESADLERIIREAEGPVFNNAAQVWNHQFYFDSLSPKEKSMSATFAEQVEGVFGTVEKFKEQLFSMAASLFGSGWLWLVLGKDGQMSLMPEQNAGNPMRKGFIPLLVIDVWEHAYYIDYRNDRMAYLQQLWHLIDWDCVEQRYNTAKNSVK